MYRHCLSKIVLFDAYAGVGVDMSASVDVYVCVDDKVNASLYADVEAGDAYIVNVGVGV